MTIFTAYAPEEFALTAEKEYAFTFPAVDDASIEVYEIIDVDGLGTEYQYLCPIQDYQLTWKKSNIRYPTLDGGRVQFNREHSYACTRVRIVRNTLIDQTSDFPKFAPFNSRNVEFALDKATMIAQEIADRKCNVTTTTPITQEVVFGSYFPFKAAQLNFAVQKLFDILLEIDQSGDDCTTDLEST